MVKYEFLEHPADLRMKVRGDDLAELFANAALGMMDYIYQDGRNECSVAKKIRVKAASGDIKALMVDWLSQMLYFSDAGRFHACKFDFRKISDSEIEAEVGGYLDVAKEDIKAVTYHNLIIESNDSGWTATVLFDI